MSSKYLCYTHICIFELCTCLLNSCHTRILILFRNAYVHRKVMSDTHFNRTIAKTCLGIRKSTRKSIKSCKHMSPHRKVYTQISGFLSYTCRQKKYRPRQFLKTRKNQITPEHSRRSRRSVH